MGIIHLNLKVTCISEMFRTKKNRELFLRTTQFSSQTSSMISQPTCQKDVGPSKKIALAEQQSYAITYGLVLQPTILHKPRLLATATLETVKRMPTLHSNFDAPNYF